jgi:hypothetical protein
VQGLDVGNPAIQTRAGQHGEFALGHIQPTAMLRYRSIGGVVKLQLAGDPAGPSIPQDRLRPARRSRTTRRGYGY